MNSEQRELKLKLNADGIEVSQLVERFSDGQIIEKEIEKIRDVDLINRYLKINKVNSTIRNGELIIYCSEFKSPERPYVVQLNKKNEQLGEEKILRIGNENIEWMANNDLLKRTAEWLFKSGRIQVNNLPVYVPEGKRYLLNTTPYHKNGRKFDGKPHEISKDIFLNVNFAAPDCKKKAEYLMKKFAPDIKFEILGFKG